MTDLRLVPGTDVLVETCPVPEGLHLVGDSYPRRAGLSLEEAIWGVAMSPIEAYRLERELDAMFPDGAA